MLKIDLPKLVLALATFGTSTFAEGDLGQEWVKVMNACEKLISDQSFDGFQDYVADQSRLNVQPQRERGFQHPKLPLHASAVSDGSAWFLCHITGDTGSGQGAIIGTLTGALFGQIRDNDDQSMVFEDGKTFAPVRVICRDEGQLTSVFAYLSDKNGLNVAATDRLPNGANNPCQ